MTLEQFLRTTAATPGPDLRRAIVRALAIEPARTPGARRRFYTRVVRLVAAAPQPAADYGTALGTPGRPDSHSSDARSQPALLAAAS
jgi:hypothetical protein